LAELKAARESNNAAVNKIEYIKINKTNSFSSGYHLTIPYNTFREKLCDIYTDLKQISLSYPSSSSSTSSSNHKNMYA
jgi:hypothetical protein